MARICLLFSILVTFGYCTFCQARTRIITTTSDLRSIASFIAGDLAEVSSMCKGDEDPHYVQIKPSQMLAARDADLWISVGMDLEEGWEGAVLDGSRNPRIRPGQLGHLDASEGVLKLEVPAKRISRELGDIHGLGNPHYWLDPYNGRIVARAIADRLSLLLPQYAESLQENLRRFQEKLDQQMFGAELVSRLDTDLLWQHQLDGTLDQFLSKQGLCEQLGGWLGKMRPFKGERIVTFHNSWVYFAKRFALEVVCHLEPKPGIPPTPKHLAAVAELMTKQNIRLILQEPFYSQRAGQRLAQQTGAKLVVVPSSVGGEKQAGDYISLLHLIVTRVSEALGGRAK